MNRNDVDECEACLSPRQFVRDTNVDVDDSIRTCSKCRHEEEPVPVVTLVEYLSYGDESGRGFTAKLSIGDDDDWFYCSRRLMTNVWTLTRHYRGTDVVFELPYFSPEALPVPASWVPVLVAAVDEFQFGEEA